MQKCNESHRWPDSPDAVPDGELDEFVAHAETCPYHEGLLRAEEEELLSTLRLAACVSGRAPGAGAGRDSGWWAEQAARFKRWAESGRLVRSVALRYRGEDVALHEWFDEVNTLVVRGLELEQGPGESCALEIWKLPDEEDEDEVFLCAYPLGGFRHGGAAQYRELPNGQTIMLRVMHAFSNKYEIEFACVGEDDSADRATWWPLGWHSQPAPWRRAPGAALWEPSPKPAPPPFGPIAIALVCLIVPWLPLSSGYGYSDRSSELQAPSTFMATSESQELTAVGRKDGGSDAGSTRARARRNLRVQPPPDDVFDPHTRQWGPRKPKPAAPAQATPTPVPVVSRRSYTCESDEPPVQVAADAPKPAAGANAEAHAVEVPLLTGAIREAGGDTSPRDEVTYPR